MRIAHIITRLIVGGAQENTLLCCRDLRAHHGHDVRLWTGPQQGPEGSLLAQARDSGVALTVVPSLRRAVHPWSDVRAYWQLRRALRDFRPHVVHTHSAKAGVLGRLAASRLRVPAIVHTVHGSPFHPYQSALARGLFRACERWAARHCHQLVSVADAMTDLLVQEGVAPREKFITIYSGMDVDAFLNCGPLRDGMRAELGYGPQHVVIGKVARLFHLKGHDDVIQAARGVVARCPPARFLFVGDGVRRGDLQRQIARAGLSGHVQFTGLLPPEQMPALMAALDIVVHASLREGLARVLPQALIAGRPVVSYDVDGAREVVLPDETGLLVPPRAVGPLADALVQLVEDAQLRQRLGAAGRARFAEQFRHERMSDQLAQLYERLLSHHPTGARARV